MKASRKILSLILCGCILFGLAASVVLPRAAATVADDLEESLLGELSATYESCGDPGAIAQVSGDTGGKSYGLYMFASSADTPKSFFTWCQNSSNAYYQGIGNTLSEVYYYGTPGYGPLFDQAWKNLAADNPEGFGRAQRDFVRAEFYNKYLAAIAEKVPSFDIADYSIALRNTLWSRAIQHGIWGATAVFTRAMDALGGFANQPESELINAIYAESGRLTTEGSIKMYGSRARYYGVEGLSLYYYSSCSSDVQLGVYVRLHINEPAAAQAMLAEYGFLDTPVTEASYLISPAGNRNLSIGADPSGLVINEHEGESGQQFHLTYYASGYYTVTHMGSSLRMTADDSGVTLAPASTSHGQFWRIVPQEDGFALQNRATGQYLSAGSFSAGGAVTVSDEPAAWQLLSGNSNWSLTGASYPTYASTLRVGASSFPFRGMLRSNFPITKVRAEVRNDSDVVQFYAEDYPGTTYYDLSKMDSSMTFGQLGSGSYTLLISAEDNSGGTYELTSPFFVADSTFTVTFKANGGVCDVTSRDYNAGQVLGELPVPTKDGKIFIGWFDENEEEVTGASVMPARDMTLTAHYAWLYTYTFYDYDGETVLATGQLRRGASIPLPKDPSRPSTDDYYYTFSGWSGYTPGMTMPKSDISFVAEYEEHLVEKYTEIVSSGAFPLIDGYLRAIPAGTTAGKIVKSLSPKDYIAIHKGSETVSGAVGTGMTVDLTVDGELIQSAEIVVTGDVNGDGSVTLTDMVQLRAHLLGRGELTGAYYQSADLNGDSQVTLTDFVQILSAVLGRSTIKPN
ncbi:MAG: InlB B-repeat-containing protein [Oscillospiraceae bacterium]|nr:InlB B-repeat-containing protein [Oscillospiraceae bacterium]